MLADNSIIGLSTSLSASLNKLSSSLSNLFASLNKQSASLNKQSASLLMRLAQTGGHYRRLVTRLPRSKTTITALRKQKFHTAVIGFGLRKQSLFLRKYPTFSKEVLHFF